MSERCKICGQKLPFIKQSGRFDKTLYQRDYMRARRAKKKAEKNGNAESLNAVALYQELVDAKKR
jgi:hypothetical protein